jgi:hypothetical protein
MSIQYYPRNAAVKATQLTTDRMAFAAEFNRDRTDYPFLVDNGEDVFLMSRSGIATRVPIDGWIVEFEHGPSVYGDADFREHFCLTAENLTV